MSDPIKDNPGATPPPDPSAGQTPGQTPAAEAQTQETPPSEAPTQATPAGEAAAAQERVAAAEQPTAQAPPAYAAAAAAPAAATPAAGGPSGPWYRRRWAIIAGVAAAAAVLFLGGMAIGDAVWGDEGRGDFRGDHPGMFRAEGDSGMVPPGMGRGDDRWDRNGGDWGMGQGQGMGQGRGWDDDGRRGYDDCDDCPQAPDATPAPSTSPQSYYQ
jgi:hypothetical protein